MRALILLCATLAGQLVLGAAGHALLAAGSGSPRRAARLGRRRWLGRVEAARTVGRPSLVAAAVVVPAWIFSASATGDAAPGGLELLRVVLGAPAAAGCVLLLHAGSLERRGRLGRARRAAYRGGREVGAGAGALALLALVTSLLQAPLPSRFDLLGVPCLAAAGAVALAGGLAAKPRPAAAVATVLYVAGQAAWIWNAG